MSTPRPVDPQTAWEPWQPSASEPWDRRRAAHLYRRACFGASHRELAQAVHRSPEVCVDRLLATAMGEHGEAGAFDAQMDGVAGSIGRDDRALLESWWLYRMLFTPAPLQERMTLLWHGHFATSAAKVRDLTLMQAQNRLLREYALGEFGELVQSISRDPAMLIYLDSTTNARLHPNENYARELMELFCLGVGNYSEGDIQETARCFTGWEVRQQQFRFNRFQHDGGVKTIFGQQGSYDGEDAVRIILSQPAAARFIARTLIGALVSDAPAPDELAEPLAQLLRDNDLQIAPVVRQILTSRYFYSAGSLGQKVRSPVDLAIGLLRTFEGTVPTVDLAHRLRPLGQSVFYPPNVKGWDGGRAWINATTMIGRVNLVSQIVSDGKAQFAGQSFDQYVAQTLGRSATPDAVVDHLAETLLAVPLPDRARQMLIEFARRNAPPDGVGAAAVLGAMSAVPEFQLA